MQLLLQDRFDTAVLRLLAELVLPLSGSYAKMQIQVPEGTEQRERRIFHMDANMSKTDKELAVELAGCYLRGYYTHASKPIDTNTLNAVLREFYEAVHSLPNHNEPLPPLPIE